MADFGFSFGHAESACGEKFVNLIKELGISCLLYIGMLILCNLLHFLLKPYSQPRITSHIIVGLIVGNIKFVHNVFDVFHETFGFIIDFGMICYMFALGVEMDPYVLLEKPTKHAKVAYPGIISTFLLAVFATPLFGYFPSVSRLLEFSSAFSILIASTDYPVLTRLITQLKIGKSDIGKLVIAAGMHTDFVCSLILSLGYIVLPLAEICPDFATKRLEPEFIIRMALVVLAQIILTAVISPFFMNWVDNENPEGKPMKGPHLILSIAFVVSMCALSALNEYRAILSAFVVGVCFPREGRVSKLVITKINYLLNTIFFPIFFLWMGYEADLSKLQPGSVATWLRIFMLVAISIIGKVIGTLISGAMLGFHWPESVAIGLLLTTKGHLQIYLAIKVMSCGNVTTPSAVIGMIIATFLTIIYTPLVVSQIIKRAKKRAPAHRLALQSLDPSSELRLLLCVHGTENVPSSLNFMEISKGSADPGILVYVTDMIELTDQILATIERDEGVHTTNVKDKKVMEMREKITNSFQNYVLDNGEEGITLKRTMALSTINNMPQDIGFLAEDLMIALIILPFHRTQRQDGTLDGGNQSFRYVNRKVLRSAPCSVGILVDRGLGRFEGIARCEVTVNVAVIFIGGKDDREALAYAERVARHPGVKLTVIRFLIDRNAESSRLIGYRIILPEQEKEMQLDDEFFAMFYEKYIIGGRISYMEKHLANAAETFSILKSFEGQYSLVIVGREGGVNSILTRGMNDWQQCPELGPIGDVLSGPDFSITVSVLIIQQHRLKGEIDGLDEDFSVMSYKYKS